MSRKSCIEDPEKYSLDFLNFTKKTECCFPTEEDLDWIETAIQRHPNGIKGWWEDNHHKLGFRELARIIITLWEAGRAKAGNQKDLCKNKG
nr:hypothetical protein 28 [Candidatus Omnitrophota bacterium]